ncbi:DUF5011 domain-containing protein, partial [bacterium]|nr:DUF5011 domain-containing protein [bacterium]
AKVGSFSSPLLIQVVRGGTNDTTAPVIALTGAAIVTVELGGTYTEAGATSDGGETVTTSGTVDVETAGVYTVTYSASDTAGNTGTATRTVTVGEPADTTSPVITLNGDATVTIPLGGKVLGFEYVDKGATAHDNVDGDLTTSIVSNSTINTSRTGRYTVIYSVTDAAGNAAEEVVRIVVVGDIIAPIIDLPILPNWYVEARPNLTYEDIYGVPWPRAMDFTDGEVDVSLDSFFDSRIPGTYYLIFTATDSDGNTTKKVSKSWLKVVDTRRPVITLKGNSAVVHEVGVFYKDAGASATDTSDGLITDIKISSTVKIHVLGSYTVTYSARDKAGNQATNITRIVNVVDSTAPVITLLGHAPMKQEVGMNFVDPGVMVQDNLDTSLAQNVVTTSNLNMGEVGTYWVKYNVSDNSGNTAVEVTRTVVVFDPNSPNPPVIPRHTPQLTDFKLVRVGQKVSFKFNFERQPSRQYLIQRSSNLIGWTNDGPPIQALPTANIYRFSRTIDTEQNLGLFYRVLVVE